MRRDRNLLSKLWFLAPASLPENAARELANGAMALRTSCASQELNNQQGCHALFPSTMSDCPF